MIECKDPLISSSFQRINIHKVHYIDHFWLNVGVSRVGLEAEPAAHIYQLIWDSLKEM